MTNSSSTHRQTLNHFRVANLATNILAGPSHDDDEEWKAHKNPFPPSVLHSAERYLVEFYDAAKLTISSSPTTVRLRGASSDGGAEEMEANSRGYHDAAGEDEGDADTVAPISPESQQRTTVIAVITLASYWSLGLVGLIGMAVMAAIHIAVEAWR